MDADKHIRRLRDHSHRVQCRRIHGRANIKGCSKDECYRPWLGPRRLFHWSLRFLPPLNTLGPRTSQAQSIGPDFPQSVAKSLARLSHVLSPTSTGRSYGYSHSIRMRKLSSPPCTAPSWQNPIKSETVITNGSTEHDTTPRSRALSTPVSPPWSPPPRVSNPNFIFWPGRPGLVQAQIQAFQTAATLLRLRRAILNNNSTTQLLGQGISHNDNVSGGQESDDTPGS